MKTRTTRYSHEKSPRGRNPERSPSRSRSRSRSKSPSRASNGNVGNVDHPKQGARKNAKKSKAESPARHSARLQVKDENRKANPEPLLFLEDSKLTKPSGMYFGGVLGAIFWPVFLPAVLLLCAIYSKNPGTLRKISLSDKFADYYNVFIIQATGAWLGAQVILNYMPIGKLVGGQIRHESRLIYRCNGLFSFVVNSIGTGLLYFTKSFPLSRLYDHWLEISTTLIGLGFLFSIIVFIKSLSCQKVDRSVDGSTKWKIYNFLVGQELNPRIFHLDLKLFCFRFGLFTWLLLDMICVMHVVDTRKNLSPTLIVLVCMHFFYIVDALFHEESFLMSSSINHDGLGFLLTFGCIAWMPLLFSMPVRFMVEQQLQISEVYLGFLFLLNMLGFIIYRGSNSQKNDFRRDANNPAFSDSVILTSKSGRKLIANGWWGVVRHPHYLGDIIMALAWTLTTGGKYALPWLYLGYLVIHLLHRIYRDERNSFKKYGHAWKVYCLKVRHFLIPKLF